MPGCPLRRTCARPPHGARRSKADQKQIKSRSKAKTRRPDSRPFSPECHPIKCGSWLASDGGLIADRFFPDVTGSNCRSEPARDSGLIGGEILAGVHIHSCGHGFYWFRSYSESLGRAPSNQTLLPLSSGASPGLGIPSLRSCSVGPPRSAIHGRARLTRHPCRVAHCAEPALGLPMGQEDQKQIKSRSKADQRQIKGRSKADQKPKLGGLTADHSLPNVTRSSVGAGLPAMVA